MHRLGIALIVVLVPVLSAGCGGDSSAREGASDASGSQSDPGKTAYIGRADHVCTRLRAKIRREVAPYLTGQSMQDLRPAAAKQMVRTVLVPELGYEIRSVRLIILPQRYVDQVLEFLGAWQEVADDAEGDPVGFVRDPNPLAKPEKLARAFGYEVCGSL